MALVAAAEAAEASAYAALAEAVPPPTTKTPRHCRGCGRRRRGRDSLVVMGRQRHRSCTAAAAILIVMMLVSFGLPSLVTAGSRRSRINNNANSRSIGVVNDSGVKVRIRCDEDDEDDDEGGLATIDVFWVNPETKVLAESAVGSGIMFGGSSGINSYVGHTFEVQEMPTKKGCVGPKKQCRKTYFTVSGDEDQVFTIEKDFTVTIENHRTKALKIAQDAINTCQPDASLPPLEQLDAYATCLSRQLNQTLEAKQEEIEFEKSVRKKMAEQMASYACDDPKLETTKATRNSTWTYRDESIAASTGANTAKRIRDVPHRVQVLFESDASTILLVKDFYSAQECQQLVDVSVPAAESTSASTSVQQRNVPLSAKSQVGPLLAKMYQLVLGYVQTNVEYTHDPMLVLQFQSGTDGSTGTTEKQGECVVSESGEATGECGPALSSAPKGTIHQADNKALAQLRVVCTKSDDLVGGAVHFPKAGVHINPAVQDLAAGYAVLTVYHDPKTGAKEKDPFVEEHVECPVQQGQLVSIVQYFVGPS